MKLPDADTGRLAGVFLLVLGGAILPAELAGQEGEGDRDDDPAAELGAEAWPILSLELGPAVDLDGPDAVMFFAGGAGLELQLGRDLGLRGDFELLFSSSGDGMFQAEAPAAVLYLDDRSAGGAKVRGGPVVWFGEGVDGPAVEVPGFFAAYSTPMGGGSVHLDLSASVLRWEGLVAGIGLDFYLR